MHSFSLENMVELDSEEIEFYCYEKNQSREVVDSIKRGIIAGDDIPPFPVVEIKEGAYMICPFTSVKTLNGKIRTVGGHHRAIGYKELGQPFKCIINKTGFFRKIYAKIILQIYGRKIEDLNIVENQDVFDRKKEYFGMYR